jgi:hypothetical protein
MAILNYSGKPQTNYYDVLPRRVGLFSQKVRTMNAINVAADLPKIAVLELDTASGNHTIVIEGVTLTVATGGSDAATATAIADAINAEYSVSGASGTAPAGTAIAARVVATVSSATVTITGKFPGDNFAISYSGTGGTLTTDGTGGSQVATETAAIPYGRLVGANAADAQTDRNTPPCRLPNSANTRIFGLAGGSAFVPYQDGILVPSYRRGDIVDILAQGVGTVELDSALTIKYGDAVYVRHTANGALTKLGAVSNASGTGLAQVTGARFESINYTVDGYLVADLALNLPA